MAFDPWAQTNSGISRLNDTLTSLNQMQSQDATNARASRLSDLQFADAQAKQNATMQASGAPDLTTAYANEMERQKQQQILEHKQKGFQTYLSTIGVLDKMPNLDPQTKTAIGKEFLRQNPEFAPMVDNLKFIDSKGVKAARNFGEGELKDPSTGQPLPAGYYETEGVWTGDVANPVKLTAYKAVKPPEGVSIPDGKGGYTTPMTTADKSAAFQSSIAGITGPSTMGAKYPVGNTSIMTGQAPFSEVEKDIRMAGADYRAPATDINKAVEDARSLYEKTYVQGTREKVKGSKSGMTPEYNLLGQRKDVAKTTDITVNVPGSGQGLTGEEQAAINRAIGSKKLDPYKVNSRNQKTLAQALIANPDADLNSIAAELGAARNKDIIMKAGVAEMIPGLIQKTAEAGKALNYSDVQFVGKVEKWRNGQLNDPKLTKYMTLRNDQLLTIGGVMRSNGMTDMAQKLEEEAMKPTLSPAALDQWLEGQLESLDPRLNFYRSLTKGNTAIPRSGYVPGTGAAGLNATSGKSQAPAPRTAANYMKNLRK